MKIQMLLTSALIGLGALIAVTLFAADPGDKEPQSQPRKWQHLALQHEVSQGIVTDELSKKIVRLGKEGWEMVTVASVTAGGTTAQLVYYFKKPL